LIIVVKAKERRQVAAKILVVISTERIRVSGIIITDSSSKIGELPRIERNILAKGAGRIARYLGY
jgi:hypothetical protein